MPICVPGRNLACLTPCCIYFPCCCDLYFTNFCLALQVGMLQLGFAKSAFYPKSTSPEERSTYRNDYAMFKIYRKHMTRFLYAKINRPKQRSYLIFLVCLQVPVTFDSNPFLLPSFAKKRRFEFYAKGRRFFGNQSLPSPQFAGFLNKVAFLIPTSCLLAH